MGLRSKCEGVSDFALQGWCGVKRPASPVSIRARVVRSPGFEKDWSNHAPPAAGQARELGTTSPVWTVSTSRAVVGDGVLFRFGA
jgi:hypothetical protein